MVSDTSLASLPSETKLQIVSHLDVKSLLALSLTCSGFRNLIQFTPDQRIQILLQLELLTQHGGKMRFYGQRPKLGGDRFATAQQIVEWGRHGWACSRCLQLLPHLDFDNKFIFGRLYRKPTHSARPCDLVWSWESELEGDPIAKIVGSSVNTIGGKRHVRQCNECLSRENSTLLRYVDEFCIQSIETPPPAASRRIPVARSRRIRCATAVDRFFPGLFEFLSRKMDGSKESPSARAVRYLGYHSRLYPIQSFKCYMLRCPSCEQWKELRSFPVPCSISCWSLEEGQVKETLFVSLDRILQFDKDHAINSGCMACLAGQQVHHDLLAEGVMALFRSEIDNAIRAAAESFYVGWKTMTAFIKFGWPEFVVQELQTVQGILDNCNGEAQNLDVLRLGKCRERLQDFMDGLCNDGSFTNDCCSQSCPRSKVAAFVKHYDVSEEQWRWLREAKTFVESTPDLLINWAIDPQNVDEFPWKQPEFLL